MCGCWIKTETTWQNRNHFFAIAGRLLRRVLIDHLRHRRALKRGGGLHNITLEGVQLCDEDGQASPIDLISLERSLVRLSEIDELAVKIVEIRFFAGLDHNEAAEVLGVGRSTVVRRWRYARAWLEADLKGLHTEAGDSKDPNLGETDAEG